MDTTSFNKNGHEENKDEALYQARSPEIQEIVGGMPPWIIRWGVTVVTILLVVIFTAAYFIRYPEIASAPVVISNSDPPIIIKSTTIGVIDSFLVEDKDTVAKKQVLAFFETDINKVHLQYLDSLLHEFRKSVDLEIITQYEWPNSLELGELELGYKDLLISINNYRKYGYGEKKIEYIQKVQDNIKIMMDYIHRWKETYVLRSRVGGIVTYLQPMKNGYYASVDEELMAILPPTHNSPIVIGKIRSTHFTKVKPGQKVLISLDAFPSQEYGYLNAEVLAISEVSINNEYIVDMRLSNNLTTTNKRDIPRQAKLTGKAEIITNDKSVLDRLLSSTKLF